MSGEKARREAATVLVLGARGKHRGAAFTLVGRTHVTSDGGGAWNEWSLAYDDEREATLAETAAGFLLFTERPVVPAFDALAIGAPLDTGFVVTERGQARRVASWGEVPDAPRTYRYADLSAASGAVATLDYADGRGPAGVFVGEPVRLADLGLKPRREPRTFLPAPGPASAAPPPGVDAWLEVGSTGELATDDGGGDGSTTARFRVIGIVGRSVAGDAPGERYAWQEYILHAPAEGLRWLVVSDGHWNLVRTVPAGAVDAGPDGARFEGQSFEPWSEGEARLDWATGELPWAAAVGDTVATRDYVHVPRMLSRESGPGEVAWSVGTYLPPDEVARAFGRRLLPKPSGRAPNQPPRPASPKRR